MYVPSVFAEERSDELVRYVETSPFATVVTTVDGTLFASHVPLTLLHVQGSAMVLYGHLARANPQWRSFDGTTEALAIFLGPHAYISPTIYGPDQAVPTWDYSSTGTSETKVSPALPTWNYTAVHAYGPIELVSDEENDDLLKASTAHFEQSWQMSDLPDDYVRQKMRAIVGFKLATTRVEGKVKMGQRQSAAGRGMVSAALRQSDDPVTREIASMMKPRQHQD